MKTVGIVSCKLGYGAASTLGPTETAFYLSVAKAVLNADVTQVQSMPIAPLVVDNETVNEDAGPVTTMMHKAFATLAKDAEVIIADLDIPPMADIRGTAHFNVYAAIKSAMNTVQHRQPCKLELLILLELMPIMLVITLFLITNLLK